MIKVKKLMRFSVFFAGALLALLGVLCSPWTFIREGPVQRVSGRDMYLIQPEDLPEVLKKSASGDGTATLKISFLTGAFPELAEKVPYTLIRPWDGRYWLNLAASQGNAHAQDGLKPFD